MDLLQAVVFWVALFQREFIGPATRRAQRIVQRTDRQPSLGTLPLHAAAAADLIAQRLDLDSRRNGVKVSRRGRVCSTRSANCLSVSLIPAPHWFSGWCFPEMEVDCWWFITP